MYVEEDRGYETPCWVWQRAKCAGGKYGNMTRGGKNVLAHRWFYEQRRGPIPAGKQLHHRCEVSLCVNPDHVEPLTPTEHNRVGARRLTAAQVQEIRSRLAAGEKRFALAVEYGVQELHIWRIKRGLTWAT